MTANSIYEMIHTEYRKIPFLDHSNILNPIIFADDAHIFYEHKNIKNIFVTVNEELININYWFMANKLSL